MDIETDGDASKGKETHLGVGTKIIATFVEQGDLEGEITGSLAIMRSDNVHGHKYTIRWSDGEVWTEVDLYGPIGGKPDLRDWRLKHGSTLEQTAGATEAVGKRHRSCTQPQQRKKPAVDVQPSTAFYATNEAGLVTNAEGLKLRLSSANATGYLHVFDRCKPDGPPRYEARPSRSKEGLGVYDTPLKAAVAVARYLRWSEEGGALAEEEAQEDDDEEDEEMEEEVVEGVKLHLSSKNTSGYLGVYSKQGRFEVRKTSDGKLIHIVGV